MCGIAGHGSKHHPVEQKLVLSLTQALIHRGPDGYGSWFAEDHRVCLGHRRLSIIDLSELGRQPMVSPDGRFVITYNGEIYNFAALREELKDGGEHFTSNTDTEVLLRLWSLQGPRCLLRLRGMYAFAIWDNLQCTLSLVRDPLGIKPLYYTEAGDALTFASEIKALRSAGFGTEVNPSAVGAFLRWGSIPAPLTFYKGISALPAASLLAWRQADGATTIESYWDFNAAWTRSQSLVQEVTSPETAIEWVRAALQDSVRSHLVSDVPVGAFLSGGIDSTAVVSFMRKSGQQKIKTFSIGSEDASLDETPYARQVAEQYGTEHHEWQISAADFARQRPAFFSSLDQPTIDGVNVFLVSKLAHDHGMKVVTSGIGGDEIFRGYELTFRHVPRLQRILQATPGWVRRAGATISSSRLSNNRLKHKSRRMASLLRAEPHLTQLYLWARELFTSNDIRKLFADPDFAEETARVDMTQFLPHGVPEDASRLAEISILEAKRYLGSQLLSDSDNFSMAHSLELRVPLVDRVLYEQLLALRDTYFSDLAGTPKSLLVAAAGDLPDNLVRRKKQGFTLPFQSWLARDAQSFTSKLFNKAVSDQIVTETRCNKRHWSAVWAMQVLDHFLASQ
ncbi:MAG: asparagine synthase (glutamine-hydrolyzing) [Acidobacteriota bacterium]